MSEARFIVGDSLDVVRSLPSASVDLVLTSPPFLALRSYLPADHPDKGKEIGSEPTPGEFIDTLLALTEEWRRVLTPHGSICVELGDTYSGSGGAGGDYNAKGLRDGQEKFSGSAAKRRRNGVVDNDRPTRVGRLDGWPLDKSLCLIPEMYRFALVYGFNPLTGRQTERWRARNVVRWHRPNPPVGALGDKFRPSTSDMVVACVGRKRYFDLDAVRVPVKEHTAKYDGGTRPHYGEMAPGAKCNPNGAPPLDTWIIPTHPYPGSHYATFPPELCVKPILAMCPERVCLECGQPSERIAETVNAAPAAAPRSVESMRRANSDDSNVWRSVVGAVASERITLGWTDCGHDNYRPGTVLDPFAGSGTTLAVATGHGRNAIGIELDERNADLAAARVGMFLTVEYHDERRPS